MAIILEAITHVWIGGRLISPGEVFSADDKFAKKLIIGKSAKVHNAVDQPKLDVDELKKTFMALKLDELKELAEKNEVELSPEDNTKAEITERLIEAGVTIE